jgi:hypothetical protein
MNGRTRWQNQFIDAVRYAAKQGVDYGWMVRITRQILAGDDEVSQQAREELESFIGGSLEPCVWIETDVGIKRSCGTEDCKAESYGCGGCGRPILMSEVLK